MIVQKIQVSIRQIARNLWGTMAGPMSRDTSQLNALEDQVKYLLEHGRPEAEIRITMSVPDAERLRELLQWRHPSPFMMDLSTQLITAIESEPMP